MGEIKITFFSMNGGYTHMARRSRSSNQLMVQQAASALEQMKYEVAQELGIQLPQDGYYGYMTSRDTGAIGGHMVRRLVQMAEQQISGARMNRF